MPTFSSIRAGSVMLVIIALFTALLGRVVYLQTLGREQTIRLAERQQHQTETLKARRGDIFASDGTLMAGSIQTQTLYIDPKFMQDCFQEDGHSLVEMDDAIDKLAKLIDKDPYEISQLLSDRSSSRYLKIAENLDDQTVAAIQKMNLPGVGMTPTSVRYYPMGSIAAHLLGGTGKDGVGLDGLELRFNKELAGHDGHERVLKDARRRPISVAADDYVPAQHGRHLVLTIDANIQMIAEQELAETCTHYSAKRGEVVVMDPKTGDVLALANWPTFNPQNLDDSTADVRRDKAVTDPYEPGSTFKPFIVGPALMAHATYAAEVFPIHGPVYRTPYGRSIKDVEGYSQLCLWDVLVKSSNIGMSMLGERLGNTRLHEFLSRWDFGQRSGIELPGEDPGKLNPLARWNKYSTESVSQGYEVMVTPLQLCRAFCAYGNGGRLVTPHLIKGELDADGNVIERRSPEKLELLPEVIDPVTAAEVKRILADVPIRGTAAHTGTRSMTWNIFGKTGTSHISEGKAGYSLTKFNSSFMAGAPAENPRLIIAFIVHEPDRTKAHYGGWVAGPGASRVLQRSLAYLQVPASPDLPLPPPSVASVLYNYNPQAYSRGTKKTTVPAEE
jgi:cell division protein FtsI/penicillin-binding protein 2